MRGAVLDHQGEQLQRQVPIVAAVVSACVLLSIYLAVRGIARVEPSVALRSD